MKKTERCTSHNTVKKKSILQFLKLELQFHGPFLFLQKKKKILFRNSYPNRLKVLRQRHGLLRHTVY